MGLWAFDGGCGLWLDADGVLAAQGTGGSSSIVGQTPADLLFAALDADGDPFDFGRFELVEEPWS